MLKPYSKHLIQNKKDREHRKTKKKAERQTCINPFKQNNDHTIIMRKIGFRSSFKVKLTLHALIN